MQESWKKIPGFSRYEVSTLGRVRSKTAGEPKIMKRRLGTGGYVRVTMQSDRGKKISAPVHMLVARTFLGPADRRIVLHKDGDETNCALSNLKYGTQKDNLKDKHRHGTSQRGARNSQALLTSTQAKGIYALKGQVTQSEAGRRFGVARQTVSDIWRGVSWSEVTGEKGT